MENCEIILPIEHQYLDNIEMLPFGIKIADFSIDKKFIYVLDYFYKKGIKNYIIIGKDFWQYISTIKKRYSVKIIAGGGIKSVTVGKKLLKLGADQIVVGSAFYKKLSLIKDFVDNFGEKVICSINDKDGWIEDTKMTRKKFVDLAKKSGMKNFIYVNENSKLKLKGVNKKLLPNIIDSFNQDFIYSGGISSLSDLKNLHSFGINKFIIGTGLYQSKFIKELI